MGRDEGDLTHLPEILQLHDLARDPDVRNAAEFHTRCENNAQSRCMHQHVFDLELCREVLEYCGFTVEHLERVVPHHLLVVGKR